MQIAASISSKFRPRRALYDKNPQKDSGHAASVPTEEMIGESGLGEGFLMRTVAWVSRAPFPLSACDLRCGGNIPKIGKRDDSTVSKLFLQKFTFFHPDFGGKIDNCFKKR